MTTRKHAVPDGLAARDRSAVLAYAQVSRGPAQSPWS